MFYRDITRFKYQLAEQITFETGLTGYSFKTEFITMYPDGRITVKEGYLWDGASGPTYDTKDSMKGSLIHDVLYECFRRELLPLSLREKADRILHDVCTAEGMDKHRADLWYDLVSKFGYNSCRPGTETKDNILNTEE